MPKRDLLHLMRRPDHALPHRMLATEPDLIREGRKAAEVLHVAEDWRALAAHYDRLSIVAWKSGSHALALRLLLAARAAAVYAGDAEHVQEMTYFLAHYHRLRGGWLPAMRWHHEQLSSELTTASALAHARSLRELSAIEEQSGNFDLGLLLADQADSVCTRFAIAPGMGREHVRVLLQRCVIERLRGNYDEALRAVRAARALADRVGDDRMTAGLVALREGTLYLVIGEADGALRAFQRAEELFTGVSYANLFMVRLRQISCLRELRRYDAALRRAVALARECGEQRDTYRLRQVLLEHADVLQEMGDNRRALDLIEGAAQLFAGLDSLEAMRFRRQRARCLIALRLNDSQAVDDLAFVLRTASAPGRQDLGRIMYALHDLLRVPEVPQLIDDDRRAVARGAVLAVELQRDPLSETTARWALHGAREDVYAAAALAHHGAGDHAGVARIIEIGRADVLDHLLRGAAPGSMVDRPRVNADARATICDFAARTAALLEGSSTRRLPLLPLPSAPAAEDLADVVVLSQIGGAGDEWWSCTATLTRGGTWRSTVTSVRPALARLVAGLARGEPLERSIASIWEALGEFLLPDPAVWQGASDHPLDLLISPDPRLWQVPYAALRRGGVDLVDVARTTLVPSLGTQVLLRARPQTARPPAHSPVASLTDPALPGHHVEDAALSRWPGGHEPIASLADLDGRAAVLYVSGTGESAGETNLGPTGLTMVGLSEARLPGTVLLNGCWSGTAASTFGRDPFNLALGALLGGARVVIAGAGLIGSAASALVGAEVLDLLARDLPPAVAVRQAQRAVRDVNPELGGHEWAGLCLVGDPTASPCPGGSPGHGTCHTKAV